VGWATCVWQAFDERDSSKKVIVKDLWMAASAQTEACIVQNIKDTIKNNNGQSILKYFLTDIGNGFVVIDGYDDNTHKLVMRGIPPVVEKLSVHLPPKVIKKNRFKRVTASHRPHSAGHLPGHRAVSFIPKEWPIIERVHYRIVFEEVGTPLHQLTEPAVVFGCLIHAVGCK
jgi:hypothetical protein